MKKNVLIIITILFTALFALMYIGLEKVYYDDFACGCSSACSGFYITEKDKIIGYTLIVLSVALIIASLWKFRNMSRLWSIVGFCTLCIAIYGNSLMLFNPNVCGLSLNESYLYFFHEKIGDWAKTDGERVDMDSITTGKLKGKLLGYYQKDNETFIFRIDRNPIKLKTSFLFWDIDQKAMEKNFSYGLTSHAVFDTINPYVQLIGGKNMPLEAFMNEVNYKAVSYGMKSQEIKQLPDGTTRVYIYK